MKEPEFYSGRPQTFVKHYFLENYLERVAYHILWSRQDFVYIDGFSGPWMSKVEAYEDTSFVIALNKLRNVREGMKRNGKEVRVRCLFVEKDPDIFKKLEEAVGSIPDMEIKVLCGSFEDLIPKINSFIGTSFSLVFIDPTGWKGYALKKITPLLMLKGEVLINFMTDFFNRFITDPRPEVAASFDPVFGNQGWYDNFVDRVESGQSREEAILGTYLNCLRKAGLFTHVTSTKVKKHQADRTYFDLVYGTHHLKGLIVFREVEKKIFPVQEKIRKAAKSKLHHALREERTSMDDLFGINDQDGSSDYFEQERALSLSNGQHEFLSVLDSRRRLKYEDLLGKILERPLVWESDLKDWIKEGCASGTVQIEGLKPRERSPKPGHFIVRVN